jgi:hypothetical protein
MVLDLAPDHCVEVCGEIIDNTNVNDANSAVEGMCVAVQGWPTKQLARQLIAATLNCLASGGPSDCSASSIADVYAACNDACAGGEVSAMVDGHPVSCIDAIDTFNNGELCHQQPVGVCKQGKTITGDLCLSTVPCPEGYTCASPPASSSDKCNQAKGNDCTVVPCKPSDGGCASTSADSEGNCGSGLKCSQPESCGDTNCST